MTLNVPTYAAVMCIELIFCQLHIVMLLLNFSIIVNSTEVSWCLVVVTYPGTSCYSTCGK